MKYLNTCFTYWHILLQRQSRFPLGVSWWLWRLNDFSLLPHWRRCGCYQWNILHSTSEQIAVKSNALQTYYNSHMTIGNIFDKYLTFRSHYIERNLKKKDKIAIIQSFSWITCLLGTQLSWKCGCRPILFALKNTQKWLHNTSFSTSWGISISQIHDACKIGKINDFLGVILSLVRNDFQFVTEEFELKWKCVLSHPLHKTNKVCVIRETKN